MTTRLLARPTIDRSTLLRALPTVIVAGWAASSVVLSLSRAPEIIAAIDTLGYPAYTPQLIGIAKACGLAAFLLPVPPRLREWAYAGFTFELGAAVFSYVAAGHAIDAIAPATVAALVGASWAVRQRPLLRETHRAQ